MDNAYLIIREGSKWADVVRLAPGETVTIGRAPTNTIVIKDERCSRNHAEIFQAGGQWQLRDLDSRNGTNVAGERIAADYGLDPGDLIQIGNSHLAFVDDLAMAFPDTSTVLKSSKLVDGDGDQLVMSAGPDDESVFDLFDSASITHRKVHSSLLDAPPREGQDDPGSSPKIGRAAAKLCRIAFELAKCTDVVSLANSALNGLFEGTQIDAGAVILRRRDES
ncbi:FHA domain-containing protein, partial [Pirellulales bacterium]|nr:FHA domain-containing protein [Pirellulales bacterium]